MGYRNSDTSGSFVVFAGLFLMAIFICGTGSALPALGAIYFMLVATNAIARGENKARRKAQQKMNRRH
ncbi:hypothetical protein EBZ39_00040 [bacterium]|nr:hypothetical protein [bacterium]